MPSEVFLCQSFCPCLLSAPRGAGAAPPSALSVKAVLTPCRAVVAGSISSLSAFPPRTCNPRGHPAGCGFACGESHSCSFTTRHPDIIVFGSLVRLCVPHTHFRLSVGLMDRYMLTKQGHRVKFTARALSPNKGNQKWTATRGSACCQTSLSGRVHPTPSLFPYRVRFRPYALSPTVPRPAVPLPGNCLCLLACSQLALT